MLQFAIQSIFVEALGPIPIFWCYFTEIQQIFIRSQIDQWEVKEHPKLDNLYIYHIVIWSELKYLIGAKVLSSRKWGSAVCKTRPKNRGFRCGSGALVLGRLGSLAVPEPNRGHGSGSNPDHGQVTRNLSSCTSPPRGGLDDLRPRIGDQFSEGWTPELNTENLKRSFRSQPM